MSVFVWQIFPWNFGGVYTPKHPLSYGPGCSVDGSCFPGLLSSCAISFSHLILFFCHSPVGIAVLGWFLARDVIYISHLCYDVSVRLSVTEVHWRIIANLCFKFRSHFTAHCGCRAASTGQNQYPLPNLVVRLENLMTNVSVFAWQFFPRILWV